MFYLHSDTFEDTPADGYVTASAQFYRRKVALSKPLHMLASACYWILKNLVKDAAISSTFFCKTIRYRPDSSLSDNNVEINEPSGNIFFWVMVFALCEIKVLYYWVHRH